MPDLTTGSTGWSFGSATERLGSGECGREDRVSSGVDGAGGLIRDGKGFCRRQRIVSNQATTEPKRMRGTGRSRGVLDSGVSRLPRAVPTAVRNDGAGRRMTQPSLE